MYTPLRVSARDPRCARAMSFLLDHAAVLSACGGWRVGLRRKVPAALGDCGVFGPLEASEGH